MFLEFISNLKGAQNPSAQIITAIYIVADVGESVVVAWGCFIIVPGFTYVCLGVAQYVGITATSKGIEDTSVTQIQVGVAHNRTFVTAGIEELALCHVYGVVLGTGGTGMFTIQVDGGAVVGIVFVKFAVEGVSFRTAVIGSFRRIRGANRLTDYTLFATAKGLETVAFLDVNGGTAPNFGVLTIAAAEDAEG